MHLHKTDVVVDTAAPELVKLAVTQSKHWSRRKKGNRDKCDVGAGIDSTQKESTLYMDSR